MGLRLVKSLQARGWNDRERSREFLIAWCSRSVHDAIVEIEMGSAHVGVYDLTR